MTMSLPSLKTMARKPSHLGSYTQPSPTGIARVSLANIGATGGFIAKVTLADPCGEKETAGLARARPLSHALIERSVRGALLFLHALALHALVARGHVDFLE